MAEIISRISYKSKKLPFQGSLFLFILHEGEEVFRFVYPGGIKFYFFHDCPAGGADFIRLREGSHAEGTDKRVCVEKMRTPDPFCALIAASLLHDAGHRPF